MSKFFLYRQLPDAQLIIDVLVFEEMFKVQSSYLVDLCKVGFYKVKKCSRYKVLTWLICVKWVSIISQA